jgi:hypothetical protein
MVEATIPTDVDLNTHVVLTDEVIELYRAAAARNRERGPGTPTPPKRAWHSAATIDNIRHWAWGIGDDNPLWSDDQYAGSTRYGVNLAPPSFLYSTSGGPLHFRSRPSREKGMGGIHQMWIGDTWRWYKPITLGTTFLYSSLGIIEVATQDKSKFAGQRMDTTNRFVIYDGNGDLLAENDTTFMSFGRSAAAKQKKHADFERHVWTGEELEKLRADVRSEYRRGAERLVWDDVKVGESIGHVVKGPMTPTEMICFLQAWGGPFSMASEITHRYLDLHPKANVPDRGTGAPDFPMRAHYDGGFAKECGYADAYDFGGQRLSWLINLVTNWMGDDAFLSTFGGQLTGLNVLGDATWCTGEIESKYVDAQGRPCIDLDLRGTNQRGEVTCVGQATVIAPA